MRDNGAARTDGTDPGGPAVSQCRPARSSGTVGQVMGLPHKPVRKKAQKTPKQIKNKQTKNGQMSNYICRRKYQEGSPFEECKCCG